MKRLSLVVALVPFLSFGQTVVSGIVAGYPRKSISFYYYDDAVTGEIMIKDTLTDSRGGVWFEFRENCERPLRVTYDITTDSNDPRWRDFYLWIKPGSANQFSIENGTSVFYHGGSSPENNLLKELGIHAGGLTIRYSGESFSEFEKKVDQQLTAKLLVLYKKSTYYGLSEAFRHFAHAQLLYGAYRTKMEALASADERQFNRFMTSVDFLSDSAYQSLTYRNGLREYFDILTTQNRKTAQRSYLLEYFRLLDHKLTHHPKTKEYLKTEILRTYGFAIEMNMDTLRQAVESVLMESPSSRYKDYLTKKLALKMTLITSVQALPDIELRDTIGNLINLKSFAGRVVFIDFWGTWCAPCMAEMPYSKDLHSLFKEKNVVFVYINSPVEPVERWKRTIRKLGIEGVHLKLSSADETKLKAFYSFEAYPFYAIHDSFGKPLNIAGGIRPSSNARQILEQLLR